MNKTQLGNYIRSRRIELNYSKRQLCSKLGWSNRAILDAIENGTTNYTIDNLILVCNALKMDYSNLIKIQENERI
jgi:transcriptional regulator with XRE-family HTH domain